MFFNDAFQILRIVNSCCLIIRRKSIWQSIPMEQPDEVLGVREAFEAANHSQKIDLSNGIYLGKNGKLVTLKCVKIAEKILGTMNLHKQYLSPLGADQYQKLAPKVIFGKDCQKINEGLYVTTQGLARTGSMRIAMTFIQHFYPGVKTVYISNPSWPNYKRIVEQSKLNADIFKYYNFREKLIDSTSLYDNISKIPKRAVILLDACGHNPTGIDPSESEWRKLSKIIKDRDLLVVMDMNSIGLASGNIEKDAYPLRLFVKEGHKIIAVQSFSKCMSLYGERAGACTILTENKEEVAKVGSQLKSIIRSQYSNPPLHGARVVIKILEDSGLQKEWRKECMEMATRLRSVRKILVEKLYKQGSTRNWEYIKRQQGSFGYLGLKPSQLIKLREKYNIFLSLNGRIGIGNINIKNVDYIAYALHFITK